MSKITFRADEELVERIEARDTSKSEIMREALREYLDSEDAGRSSVDAHAADTHATSAERGRDCDAHDRTNAGRESTVRESPSHQSVDGRGDRRTADALDAVLTERVDELVSERLAAWEARRRERETERAQDVNVNVTLESDGPVRDADGDADRRAVASDRSSDTQSATVERDAANGDETACGQCGESLSDDHVYCPNCGEKAARRVFCECGDEVRSDWGFCPSCGRRTPAADVLDRS